MYSSEDLERLYFQYQTEAKPKGISIEQFCSRNKVPYNIFYKCWRKRSIPTHSGWLYPLTFDAEKGLKEA